MVRTSCSPVRSTVLSLNAREHILEIFLFGDFSKIFSMNAMKVLNIPCGKGIKIVTALVLGDCGCSGGGEESRTLHYRFQFP